MCIYMCTASPMNEAKAIMRSILVPLGDESSRSLKLERAVCNHGFFMMAPNIWVPSEKTLVRPLRIPVGSTVVVSISQPLTSFIQIDVLNHDQLLLSSQDLLAIRRQVERMLRISGRDEMQVQKFHEIHPQAKKKCFGRIFRSPTLFEDIVKSILLCNCSWERSLEMAQALCDLQHKLALSARRRDQQKSGSRKRKRSSSSTGNNFDVILKIHVKGDFPSPKELAALDEETLNRHCKLGYRAQIIIRIAQEVVNGTLNLEDILMELHDYNLPPDKLYGRLMKIKGFGAFTTANVMMCLGFYQEIPADTETNKHLEEVHGKTKLKKENLAAAIEQIYGKYGPFQCLAYWFERVEYYERRLGQKLSELPYSKYANVSSTNMQ